MRKEPSVTVAVKKREGQMDELFRGSQRRSEVNWGRDDRSPLRMRHTLLPLCVFFLPEKKVLLRHRTATHGGSARAAI